MIYLIDTTIYLSNLSFNCVNEVGRYFFIKILGHGIEPRTDGMFNFDWRQIASHWQTNFRSKDHGS